MLSKSRNQALRLAPVMHLLFHFGEEGNLSDDVSDAAICLAQKKFRKRGNKDGASRAFYQLETEGLGKVLKVVCGKGTSVVRGAK